MTKACTQCKQIFPATSEFFCWESKSKGKLNARCKPCLSERRKANADYMREYSKKWRMVNDADIKKKKKIYRQKNKDIIKERSRIYAQKYREEIKKRKAIEYQNNKERYRQKSREYHKKNAERNRQRVKEWAKNNPDQHREAKLRAGRKRRAVIKGSPTSPYTENNVISTYGINCHICGLKIDLSLPRQVGKPGWEKGLHIDHLIPISKGGPDTLENVRPAHGRCNIDKGATI
jgi:5-methylcytosine-specific restriction endonuclease McrA